MPEEGGGGGVIIMRDPSSSCREIKASVYYKETDVIMNTFLATWAMKLGQGHTVLPLNVF